MKLYTVVLMGGLLAGCAVTPEPQTAVTPDEAAAFAFIQKHVEAMWQVPPGYSVPGKSVIMEVYLDPTGRVETMNVLKSSGNAGFDASLERAIRKASPFPIPTGSGDKFRRLELHFSR